MKKTSTFYLCRWSLPAPGWCESSEALSLLDRLSRCFFPKEVLDNLGEFPLPQLVLNGSIFRPKPLASFLQLVQALQGWVLCNRSETRFCDQALYEICKNFYNHIHLPSVSQIQCWQCSLVVWITLWGACVECFQEQCYCAATGVFQPDSFGLAFLHGRCQHGLDHWRCLHKHVRVSSHVSIGSFDVQVMRIFRM